MKVWIFIFFGLCLWVPLMAQEKKGTAIEVGQTAPEIITKDIAGNPVHLDALTKDGKVVLSFMRYAGCPVCTYRVHELKQQHESLKAQGYTLIVVFESSPEVLLQYQREFDLPFTIIADPSNRLYDAYAVETSAGKMLKTSRQKEINQQFKAGKEMYANKYKRDGKMTRIGADFVIGPGRVVLKVHYGAHIGDHLELSTLLARN